MLGLLLVHVRKGRAHLCVCLDEVGHGIRGLGVKVGDFVCLGVGECMCGCMCRCVCVCVCVCKNVRVCVFRACLSPCTESSAPAPTAADACPPGRRPSLRMS